MSGKRIARHILIFTALVACLRETEALSYQDDNLFENRIDRNWSYEVPSVDQIADFWVKSQFYRTEGLDNEYSKEGETFDNEYLAEPAEVLTDSYEIGKHSLRKVYCVISQGERNCMEVGMKKDKNSPVKIRIRSGPKTLKKKIGSEEENQGSIAQEFHLLKKEKHYSNFNENIKHQESKNRSFYASGFDGYFNVHNKQIAEYPRYQYELQDSKRRKREAPAEDYSYGDEEEDYSEESDKEQPSDESKEQKKPMANYRTKNNKASKEYDEPEESYPAESEEKNDGGEVADDYKEPEVRYRSKSAEVAKDDDGTFIWYRCKMPKKAKNAEILCKKWNTAVACNLYCAYGYRFPEGIKRTTSCKYNEGKWTKPFSECQPYIDCSVRLRTPGSLYCTVNHMKSGAECGISCEKSAMHKKYDERKYICADEGRWSPQLPPCVESEGLDVLEPPDVTVHKELTYPSKYPQ